MRKKKLTLAVKFHEKAIQEGITKSGVVVCSTAPLPMSEWKDSGKPKMAYRSFADRLNGSIKIMEQDVERYSDSDLSYDNGYLAGLQQALKMYKED